MFLTILLFVGLIWIMAGIFSMVAAIDECYSRSSIVSFAFVFLGVWLVWLGSVDRFVLRVVFYSAVALSFPVAGLFVAVKSESGWGKISGMLTLIIGVLSLFWVFFSYYGPTFFTDYYFGEALNVYDESLLIPVSSGGRQWSCRRGEDGRVLIEFKPKEKSELFDTYVVHCFPDGMRPFVISAHRKFENEEDAQAHYDRVARILKQKYGRPVYKTVDGLRYNLGGKSIGLVWNSLTGKPIVYYSVFRDELSAELPKNVKSYLRKSRKMMKEKEYQDNERLGRVL